MTQDTIHSVSWLLEQLADPFAIFPLQDVARSLTASITESSEAFRLRAGPYGVARRYWDVPMEILDEQVGVAIGSAFVLGQAAIVQAVSIVTQVRKLTHAHTAIPSGKKQILESSSAPSSTPGIGNITVIDTAANYFKHHHEWPANWHEAVSTGVQHHTITNAKLLGMAGHDVTINMYAALDALQIGADKVFTVPMTVHEWRERLAHRISKDLGLSESVADEA